MNKAWKTASPIDSENPGIVCVIPVFNHGKRILGVLEKLLPFGFPVFVIDDGSTDGLQQTLKHVEGIHLIRHERNLGKGAALISAFQACRGIADWVITMDADGQHDPDDIVRLIRKLPEGKRPIIIGNRQEMLKEKAPWTSRMGRGFSNFWVRCSGGPSVRDSQSGFRMYPLPEVLELGVKSKRYQFEVEILVRAKWHGIPILEAPIRADYGKKLPRVSHFHPLMDFFRNTMVFSRLIFLRLFVPVNRRKYY